MRIQAVLVGLVAVNLLVWVALYEWGFDRGFRQGHKKASDFCSQLLESR